jgi:hypothetical protein
MRHFKELLEGKNITLKDPSTPMLFAEIERIKGSKVNNKDEGMSYRNYPLPALKHYNAKRNLPSFTFDDMPMNYDLCIVGSRVESNSIGSAGDENAWGGKLYIVPLDIGKKYLASKNWSMKHSESMTFYDNALPDAGALKKVVTAAKKLASEILNAYIAEYGNENVEIEDDKEYEFSTRDGLPLGVTRDSISQSDTVYNKAIIARIEDENNVDYNDKGAFMSLSIFGKEGPKTIKALQKEFNKLKKDWIVLGMNFTSTKGQDWNGKIWKHGGMYTLSLVSREFQPSDVRITTKL